MNLNGMAEFSSYEDFKRRMNFQALVQTESKEKQEDEYYSALEDLDYFECKKYGKLVGEGNHKDFIPFVGNKLRTLKGGFILNYRKGKIESIVCSPAVLCEWYERKGL